MAQYSAVPQCFLECYPFEGGSYSIQGGQILACTVSRDIKADAGTFTIELAPGGPFGANAAPSWTDVITPMSLCLVGMSRGIYRQIVMIGVVTNVDEPQVWRETVSRSVTISGQDFGYFFNSFNWCALTFLGGPATAIGQALGTATAGIPALLGSSLLNGPPNQVAAAWYNKIMAGTSGILAQTSFLYRQQRVTFPQAMATLFAAYPGFTIPFGDYFIAAEGNWTSKFRSILQWPWYEFFVTTAPVGFYGGAAPAGTVTLGQPVIVQPGTGGGLDEVTVTAPTPTGGGYQFTMAGIGNAPACPTLVARVNPLPQVAVTTNGANVTFGAIDATAWNALPLFTLDTGFSDSRLSFDESEVRNFYMLNPVWFRRMFGDVGDGLAPFILSFLGAYDAASIHRYGYRPEYTETRWLSDLNGDVAAAQSVDVFNLAASLTGRLISYYEPTSLMGRAGVIMPLRPDIMIGCRFKYPPLKNEGPWDFYIESVTHTFIFGGKPTTSLRLTRGLPSVVYSDTSQSGVLTQMHLGNAQRLNGIYSVGLPPGSAGGLRPFGINQTDQVMGNIAKVYVTAQAQ